MPRSPCDERNGDGFAEDVVGTMPLWEVGEGRS